MTEFVSKTKLVEAPSFVVYETLSDLSNLQAIQHLIPSDKVNQFSFDRDSCSFVVDAMGVGQIDLRVVDREPNKTVKIASEKSPVAFTLWIQIKESGADQCYLRLTLRADLPFMLKGMLSKPLQEGLDKAAEAIASYHF